MRLNSCVIAVVCLVSPAVLAQDGSAVVGSFARPTLAQTSAVCDARPACGGAACADKICRLHVETETLQKTCFEVECRPICVPPITFPWEQSPCCVAGCDGAAPCPPQKCGRVRYVNVPLTRAYECGTECVCEWKLEDAGLGCTPGPAGAPLPPAPPAEDDDSRNSADRRPAGRPATLGWLRWPWRS